MIDLQFDRVSKKYRIQRELSPGASNGPLSRMRNFRERHGDFWALKDMSFQVAQGETLGIIGPNGAGKSTILKLLSKITTPTSGRIMINGRLSALIEVGSGFHPELTGRENVYLSGSILGMRRREITNKLESIIDFAGVRQFIDVPVKRYSSGMYVRLGFSIAAHLQPDILLLDEVLAVGDAEFQSRCLQRISELRESGTTIVFISHDLSAVSRLCGRTLLVRDGEVAGDGPPSEIIAQYRCLLPDVPQPIASSVESAEITSLKLFDSDRREPVAFRTGYPINVHVEFTARKRLDDVVVEVFLHSAGWSRYCHLTTELSNETINLEPGHGTIDFSCAALGLQPGIYQASATIIHRGQSPGNTIVWRPQMATFIVEPGKVVRGSFYMPYAWKVDNNQSVGRRSYLEASLSEALPQL